MIRFTKQRKKVLSVIEELGDNATLKNIEQACIKEMDPSTVYRILDCFLQNGMVIKNLNYQGEISYSIFHEHEHFFYCVKCHKKEKIECPVETCEEELEKSGKVVLNHTLRIDGICHPCSLEK